MIGDLVAIEEALPEDAHFIVQGGWVEGFSGGLVGVGEKKVFI